MQERLAAELAAYAQMRDSAAALEVELEAARERANVAGHAEHQQMEQSQQAVARLSEENERRSGEVHGELAMLGTEAKELRRNLVLLQEERRAIRITLEHVRASPKSGEGALTRILVSSVVSDMFGSVVPLQWKSCTTCFCMVMHSRVPSPLSWCRLTNITCSSFPTCLHKDLLRDKSWLLVLTTKESTLRAILLCTPLNT